MTSAWALGRSDQAEVVKSGALLAGQRDDHSREKPVSTGPDSRIHRKCDLCGDELEAENTCPWTELLVLPLGEAAPD